MIAGHSGEIFVSYTHRDVRALDDFRDAMRGLGVAEHLSIWDDTAVRPGANWAQEVEQRLESAQLIVLLVSPHFLASDFVKQVELPRVFRQARDRGADVVPVMVSPSVLPSELEEFRVYPSDGSSISDQADTRRAWLTVAHFVVHRLMGSDRGGFIDSPRDDNEPNQPIGATQAIRALKQVGFEVQRRTDVNYVLVDDSVPPRYVSIPRNISAIRGGLLRQILRAAGLTEGEFRSLVIGP